MTRLICLWPASENPEVDLPRAAMLDSKPIDPDSDIFAHYDEGALYGEVFHITDQHGNLVAFAQTTTAEPQCT